MLSFIDDYMGTNIISYITTTTLSLLTKSIQPYLIDDDDRLVVLAEAVGLASHCIIFKKITVEEELYDCYLNNL